MYAHARGYDCLRRNELGKGKRSKPQEHPVNETLCLPAPPTASPRPAGLSASIPLPGWPRWSGLPRTASPGCRSHATRASGQKVNDKHFPVCQRRTTTFHVTQQDGWTESQHHNNWTQAGEPSTPPTHHGQAKPGTPIPIWSRLIMHLMTWEGLYTHQLTSIHPPTTIGRGGGSTGIAVPWSQAENVNFISLRSV